MKLFKSNVLENGEQQRKTNQNIPSWKLNISDNYWFSISDILMEYLSISQCCFTSSTHQCWQKQILEAGDCLCDEAEGDGDSLSSPRSCSDNARWGVMKISKLEQCYPPCLINNDGAFLSRYRVKMGKINNSPPFRWCHGRTVFATTPAQAEGGVWPQISRGRRGSGESTCVHCSVVTKPVSAQEEGVGAVQEGLGRRPLWVQQAPGHRGHAAWERTSGDRRWLHTTR